MTDSTEPTATTATEVPDAYGSGQPDVTPDDRIRLLDLRESPLSADEVLAAIADPRAGGFCLFVGAVRDHDEGRSVTELGYEAHPLALRELRAVAEEVVAAHPVCGLAAVHRIGDLAIGEAAVVVGVSAPHRDAAFAAARMLIDDLKARVPLWKHQRFTDGDAEWVGA
ncbi:molybdenum cofactor biosynthesis protein MoaE [Actinopolymorpha singaporensis]|uniref:Molybdopterin synthase catalytic subunit 1 n=1 Tax=Actinopolymorpha singaporensis TaxID=117157 RepID=A0A1H1YP51_9ACTN|nr:molybdopterin synthase catalytic subunit [Actinopolymorpha singaporensis]